MARPTLNGHPKFAHLAGLVGGRGPARGYLELIWDAAYACGEPIIGDARKVEAVADWRGPRGELAASLVESGFLDAVQTDANGKQLQTFAVHDLEHHAPDYVLKRWQREAERKAKGETIRSVRQKAALSRWAMQMDANGEQTASKPNAPVLPHAPAPALKKFLGAGARAHDPPTTEPPESTAPPPPIEPRLRVDAFAAATSAEFDRVFLAYPRKDAKSRAGLAFQALAAGHPGGEKALADAILTALPAMLKRAPYNGPNAKRPYLETVLAERRWEDPESAPDAAPKADPRCNLHRQQGTFRTLPRGGPVAGCPTCKENSAARGTRDSPPTNAADALPKFTPGKAWTPEQLAEAEQLRRGTG